MPTGEDWMSMTDARDYLGVTQATLHRLVYGDAIRAFKRGRESGSARWTPTRTSKLR